MINAVFMCCAILGQNAAPASTPAAPADLKAYEAARSQAGPDAHGQVRLALWCEAHGLTKERLEHLARAAALDPRNALVRGLMGLVDHRGKWERPEAVQKQVQTDSDYQKLVREYLDRRARTPEKADAQLHLAAWCTQNGLTEQALAHYTAVTRLDPSREIAWRHLGYKKQGNRWVKPEAAAAEKLEAERQKHSDQRWRPRLEKLRDGLLSTHSARREKAERELLEVTDPRAVPMVWQVFAGGGEASQLLAVRLLDRIEGPGASHALATLAVFSPSGNVRRRAADLLVHRDPRDVVGRLTSLVRKPFKYTVQPGSGPGSTGELFVEGERFDLRRLYQFPTMDFRLIPTTVPVLLGPAGVSGAATGSSGSSNNRLASISELNLRLAGAMAEQAERLRQAAIVETFQRNATVQQSLANDVQTLEAANAEIRELDDRVLPILKVLTGQDFGTEPDAWRKWWTDQLGYVYQSSRPSTKPTFTDTTAMPNVSVAAQEPVFVAAVQAAQTHSSCFAAGTAVHTLDGPRAIESIQVGDRVLSQDPVSGSLAFEPVVAVHHNDPAPTLRIEATGDTIIATGIHRFWKVGKGWTMARELKPGDQVRVIGGAAQVRSIENERTLPVYNLDVARNRDFFVGTEGLLVHDFSFVQPVLAPFDRQSDVAMGAP
jgi:hypothetical protein